MAAVKRPPLPLVLTGNQVIDGDVVYYDGADWTRRLADAQVARDADEAAALEAALAVAERRVVEPFLVTVALGGDGRPAPAHYRDHIRISGPTFDGAQGVAAVAAGAH